MSHNIASFQDPDFRQCGVIMVAPKRNTFAMACIYCESTFIRLQAFMRHLHQRHKEELQFEAELEVYAVEELDEDSEESGVADNDIATSENEEDKSKQEGPKTKVKYPKENIKPNVEVINDVSARHVAKEATLGNMSILNALEDFDVSLNFIVNMDSANVDRTHDVVESKKGEGCDVNETSNDIDIEDGMDMEANELDMDSEFIKRIQMDLEMENVEDQDQTNRSFNLKAIANASQIVDGNSFLEDEDLETTITEDNQNKSSDNSSLTEVSSLNNLLLSGLDDVDALLYNIEKGAVGQQEVTETKLKTSDENMELLENLDEELDDYGLNASILEQCLADDNLDEANANQVEEKLNQVSEGNSKEQESNRGYTSALNLQVMAEWGMDDIDLEDCMISIEANANFDENQQINEALKTEEVAYNISGSGIKIVLESEAKSISYKNDGHIETISMMSKEVTINENLLELTPKTSMGFEGIIEGYETLKDNDSTLEYEGTNKMNKVPAKSFLKHNTSCSPKPDEVHTMSCKTSLMSPRTPEMQKEKFFTDGVEKEINTPKSSRQTPKTSKQSSPKEKFFTDGVEKEINTPKSLRQTPKTSKQASPKEKFFTDGVEKEINIPKSLRQTPRASKQASPKEKFFTDGVEKEINTPKSLRQTPRASKQASPKEKISTDGVEKEINTPKSLRQTPRASKKASPKEKIYSDGVDKEINTPKLSRQTPRTPKQASPKEKYAKSIDKKSPVKEVETSNKEKTPKFKTPINHAQAETPLAEYEKELETNIFYEGLTEENSSTHLYKETKITSPETNGYTLQSLLNKELEDEDLETLINQLETSNTDFIDGNQCETSAVESLAIMQKEDVAGDNEDDVMDEEMAIFNKFVNAIAQQVACESQPDVEDDFENLLNDDLSKALENALEEENSKSLEENEESIVKQEEQQKVKSIENSKEDVDVNISELRKDCGDVRKDAENENLQQEANTKTKEDTPNKTDSNQYIGKYAKTNQKAKNIQGKPVIEMVSVPPPTKKRQRNRKQSEKEVYSQKKAYPENTVFNPFETTTQTPKKFKENKENSPVENNFWSNVNKSVLHSETELITDNMENRFLPNGFINMQRGDRTPVKLSDLFLKQSPKSREKTGEKSGHNPIQWTPDGKAYKKTPTECKKNIKQMISPENTRTKSEQQNQTGKFSEDLNNVNRQKLRNVSVKLQRWSSTQSINKSYEKQITPNNNKSPRTVQQGEEKKNIPLSALETEKWTHGLKLPNCITISKVNKNSSPTMLEVTPSKSNYCKQNFTEQEIDGLYPGGDNSESEAILKHLPSSLTVTKTNVPTGKRARAREASIDIMPKPNSPKKNKLDYKSYAVNRSERKKAVLQRMRSIKKQIFKPNVSQTLGNVVKSQMNNKEKRSSLIKINRVQILPNVQEQVLTPLLEGQHISPQMAILQGGFSNKTPKSLINSPKHATQDLVTSIRYLEFKTPKILKSAEKIENQRESPTFISKSNTPEKPSTAAIKANDISPTTNRVCLSKRPATSPLAEDQGPKRLHTSPNQMKLDIKPANAAKTQSSLPKSVKDFLEAKRKNRQAAAKNRDLKASRVNLDGLLNEQEMPMDDMTPDQSPKKNTKSNNPGKSNERDENSVTTNVLPIHLKQVKSEDSQDSQNHTNLKEKEAIPNVNCIKITRNAQMSSLNPHVEDYDYSKDLDLLEKFGLNILVDTDAEDFCDLQEVEQIRAKSKKFADILHKFKRLCSCSKLIEPVKIFQDLRSNVNSSFGENISINDMKRLINLFIIWYTNSYNNKLLHKKPVSESSNHYLLIFNFIPKTAKRIYYCEFCDDNFNSEHKYYTHRTVHTGARFPYMCKFCSMGYNRANMLKTHYEHKMCSGNKSKQVKTEKMYISKVETSKTIRDDKVNGRPSVKLRPNTYTCKKCNILVSSEADAKLHIISCNSLQPRQPKSTPRPRPKAEPYSRN